MGKGSISGALGDLVERLEYVLNISDAHVQAEAADSFPVFPHFHCVLYGPRLRQGTGKVSEENNNKTQTDIVMENSPAQGAMVAAANTWGSHPLGFSTQCGQRQGSVGRSSPFAIHSRRAVFQQPLSPSD